MSQPLAAERQRYILEELANQGRVIAQQLATALNVSIDTIRRDLNELAANHQLVKVHGGAVKRGSAPLPRSTREHLYKAAKTAIGKLAANMIRPQQTVLFDNSTTVLEIVRHIDPSLRFTGITHSLPTALALAALSNAEVIMIGGKINNQELMSADTETIERIGRFRADIGFLGICCIHPEAGVSTDHYEDMLIKQAIVNQSEFIVAPVSPDKFNQVLPYLVCPLTKLDYLVLDQLPEAETAAPYLAASVKLIAPEGAME